MVIFLAGVHGVGKTFLGKPASSVLGLQYATASSLIKAGLNDEENWLEDKRTSDVDKNQEILISSVFKLIRDSNNPLILDGHFVLRNQQGHLVELPSSVFQRLGVSSVILIEAPASVIAERLVARGAPQSLSNIEELANAERENAERTCNELNIPLFKLLSPSQEQLINTIQKITG